MAIRDELDVVALGSAIVDVLTPVDEDALFALELVKGTMALVGAEEAERLAAAVGAALEVSGGSAANTAVGVASFGGSAAFVGKVADDRLGAVFAADIRAAGVEFRTPPAPDGAPTARCVVLVTPDAQRTMATCLGAATALEPEDVDPDLVARARVTYLEGYLWDPPQAIRALRRATAVARAAGRTVALSLSDPFCVERHRDEFLGLLGSEVDLVFANEAEALSLVGTEGLDEAIAELGRRCPVAVVTRGPAGSVVVAGDEVHHVDAHPVDQVVDTTGAGDLYAAGFLFGLTSGAGLRRCAELGSLAAAEVISHVGARPRVPLASLL